MSDIKKSDLVNEHGKPLFPKYVTDKEGKRVIVNTPDEEKKIAGKAPNADWK